MIKGYWGKILRIDLSSRKIVEQELDPELLRVVIGGAGLGAKILYDEVSREVGPYDPENKLIFGIGPFQGTKIPGAAKWSVISKSPITRIFADSAGGSSWGYLFKRCGYDSLVIEGKAENPVYILITSEKVKIEDASEIWGKDAIETINILRSRIKSRNVSIACIGKAGENLVGIANIVIDEHSFAGRCGLGAVMGSKNLKAVIVTGDKEIPFYDKDRLEDISKNLRKKVAREAKFLNTDGTIGGVIPAEEKGYLPIKYWRGDTWKEGVKNISAPVYNKILKAKPKSCIYCPIGCHRLINVEISPGEFLKGSGPEYETLGMLGSNCLIDDLIAITKANDLCTRYGIDTISAGAFLGFAIECYERGLLSTEDCAGLNLKWGDGELLQDFIKQLGEKKGMGELFADGIIEAAKKIGKEAEEIAVHVKGLDLPAIDGRAFYSLSLNYATGTRGACHMRGYPHISSLGALYPEAGITEVQNRFSIEKIEYLTAKYQDLCALYNSLVLCQFMIWGKMTLTDIVECLNAITGWSLTVKDAMGVGEAIFNLQRLVDVKFGAKRSDDKLPKRMFEPARRGGRAGKYIPFFDKILDKYYNFRGWDRNGKPTLEKIKELNLDKVVSEVI